MSIPIFILKALRTSTPPNPTVRFSCIRVVTATAFGMSRIPTANVMPVWWLPLRTPMTLTTRVGWILMATSTSSTAVWMFPTEIISPGTFSSIGDCHVDSFGDVIDFYYGINYSYGVFGSCATLLLSVHQ